MYDLGGLKPPVPLDDIVLADADAEQDLDMSAVGANSIALKGVSAGELARLRAQVEFLDEDWDPERHEVSQTVSE